MNLENFKKIEVIGERPEEAPDGWIVFNAPRPLYGTTVETGKWSSSPTIWLGDFVSGVHYAAVDPAPEDMKYNDPQMWVDENRRLDAQVVTWISSEEHEIRVMKWVEEVFAAYALERYKIKIDGSEWDAREYDRSYRNWYEDEARIIGPWMEDE